MLFRSLTERERAPVYAAIGVMGGRGEVARLLRVPHPPKDLGERFAAAHRKASAAGVGA